MGVPRRPAAPTTIVLFLLFRAVTAFAESSPDATTIPVPLVVNGRRADEIPVLIVTDADFTEHVSVIPSELASSLPELVPSAASSPLLASEEWTPLEAFDEIGLAVGFDWDELLLRVTVPARLLEAVELPLSGRRTTAPRGVEVSQADVSGIMNLEGSVRYTYEQNRVDYRVTPDVAINLYRAVIELRGGVRSSAPIAFLDHARLTWDVPEFHIRLQAGDLRYRETQLTGVTRITGVSFATEESLGDAMIGGGGVELPVVIPETGSVVVTRNGSQVVRRTLDPGNYLLTALPLVQGINEITVTWPGPDGPTTVDLLVPHDAQLVRPGRLDAGLAVGIANRDVLDPMATVSAAYGFAQPLTLGARFGSAFLRSEFDAGVSAVLATAAGAFRVAGDVGIGPNGRLAVDVPVGYRFVDSRVDRFSSIGATAGVGYALEPSGEELAEAVRFSASGYVGLAFRDGFSVTPRLSYSVRSAGGTAAGDGTREVTHDARFVAGLRKSVRGGSSVSANLGLSYRDELTFLASVSYSASFPEVRQNLYLQQDLTAGKASLFWSRYAGDGPRDLSWSASAQVPVDRSDLFTVGAQAGYRGPALRGSISHGLSGVLDDEEYRNVTSLSLASALLFADGVFAVSTPVSDSFVLVTGDPASAVPIGLMRPGGFRDEPLAERPLVFGGVRSYAPFQVQAEPLDIVLGAEDRELSYHVQPSYRSGTVVRIGVERNVYVGGVLLDGAERAVGFALGSWERRADSERRDDREQGESAERRGEFFTDADGYFEIYNLAPGTYLLRLAGRPGVAYEFTIEPGSADYVDLGNLMPTAAGEQPGEGDHG